MPYAYQEHYTVEDYLRWEGDWELIHGMPYAMSPAPTLRHQRLERQLLLQLASSLQSCPNCEVLAEVDWHVNSDTVVQPDLVITCHQEEGAYLQHPPHTIIEILSPSTAKRDKVLKYELYQQAGVLYYLLVDPETQSVKIFQNQNEHYVLIEEMPKTWKIQIDGCPIQLNFTQIWASL